MRPLRLQVTHFGPYLGEQSVDFEALGRHGLFLIHGPTGAGKSSILDAICFALFGEASGDERKGSDLATTLQQEERTKVVLDFEHRGKLYRITRHPQQELLKQRGEGTTTKQPEATLEDLDTGAVLASKVTEAKKAVEELLCCTVKQFRQTVVLPQGAFREVITDDQERRPILANIFATGRFAKFAGKLDEKAKKLYPKGKSMQEQRDNLLEGVECEDEKELVERVKLAKEVAEGLAGKRDAASAERDKRLKEWTVAGELAKKFDEAEELHGKQGELNQRAEAMGQLREQLKRGKLAAGLADARSNLETVRQETADLREELEGAQEALGRATETAREAEQALQAEEDRGPERKEAESECGRLEALEKQVAELSALQQRESELAEQVEKLAAAIEEKRVVVGEAQERRSGLATSHAECVEKVSGEAELERRSGQLARAVGALREIEDEWSEIERLGRAIDELISEGDPREGLSEAIEIHAPGLLASSLGGGEPCPVCGSLDHPAPVNIDSGLEGLQQAFEAFGSARAEVSRLEEGRRQRQARVNRLAEEHGWLIDQLPVLADRQDELEAVEARLHELRELKGEIAELDEQLRQMDEEELPRLNGELEGLKSNHGDAQLELGEHRGGLKQLLNQLEREQRDPESFRTALEAVRERHRSLQEALKRASEKKLEAVGKVESQGRLAANLQAKVETANEKLTGLEEQFASRLEKEGFADIDELDRALLAPDELAELEVKVSAHDEEVREVAGRLGVLRDQLAGKERPDLEALERAHEEAETALEQATENWHAAELRRSQFAQAQKQLGEIKRKYSDLKKRIEAARKLADLACGRLTGIARVDFETFVLQSIFHEVLAVGNRRLKHMTGGRYSLHLRLSDAASSKGLELDVSDHHSGGRKRPVRTLSGGEGFLASLALALGLSEIAQRKSGGSELGALFIDEGFGSLDPKSLDQAVRILRDLPQEHRLVGVISHVEELKQRIPVQLLVEQGRMGSRIGVRVNG